MTLFGRKIEREQLGQVLTQRGIISQEKLKQALEVQKEKGGLLGEVLITLGFTTEEEIAQALAIQHDFPYLPLANYEVDPEVVKLIPKSLASENYILAIDKIGSILTVVMANPLDTKLIEEIEALTKCKIEIFVATYTEIRDTIEHCYTQKLSAKNEDDRNA